MAEAIHWLESYPQGGKERTAEAILCNPTIRPRINKGEVCVLNAVWGLRSRGGKTGYLGEDVHRKAFPIWATAIQRLEPQSVFLCGEWAKWPDLEWGRAENGSNQIERWKKWAGNQTEICPVTFGKQEFYIIPHPSAWCFDFTTFLKGMKL